MKNIPWLLFCVLLCTPLCPLSICMLKSEPPLPWDDRLPGIGASLGAQLVKNPPAIQKTQVESLGQKDPLEKG